MTIADSIKKEFEGIHSNQLIGEDNPGTLDKHPLFFIWEKIHAIEQEFPPSELEGHFLVDYLTNHPTTNHTSYQDLFAKWEADIKSQEQSHQSNVVSLIELVNFLIEVDECMWISKLDEALRGDTTFKALIIWLLSQGPESERIFETIHNTRDPETDITYFSYGEDEFFAREHYDATECEEETDETTIDQLPIPSSIHEVEKDGDHKALQLFKGRRSIHGQLVKICSDKKEINDLLSQNEIDDSETHFIQVPEKTHIPLCIGHFREACNIIRYLRQADINRFHPFLSAGGHPGMLSYDSGRSGLGTSSQEPRDAPEGFSTGYGIQQDSQGQDVFIIFLRINQLFESFNERLPAALDKYKSEHNGLPIGIVAYGPGMWEIFSHFLFLGCEGEGVIANVDCLLHFTDAGQPKTEASPCSPTLGRGWQTKTSDFSDPRGYWTE
jgi:hypothetical protein